MSSDRTTAAALAEWAKHNKLAAFASLFVFVFVPVAVYRVLTDYGALPAALLVGGIALAWTADLIPRQLADFFTDNWPFLSMMCGAFTLATLHEFTNRTGSEAFYEASAQVIPVLLLAMALEVRLLPRRLTGSSLRTGMLIVYLLAGAEFAALQSIERGQGGQSQFEFTVAGLVCGFVAVSLIAVSATVNKPSDDEGDS